MKRIKTMLLTLALLLTAGVLTAEAKKITTNGVMPAKGTGTGWAPFQITNAMELRGFVNFANRTQLTVSEAILMCDIDLSEICGPELGSWIPLGYQENPYVNKFKFAGKLYGNGHKITGLYIDGNDFDEDDAIGFLGEITEPLINDLTVEGTIVNPTKRTGGLIGATYDWGGPEIYNCLVRVNISGQAKNGSSIGGMLGEIPQTALSKSTTAAATAT